MTFRFSTFQPFPGPLTAEGHVGEDPVERQYIEKKNQGLPYFSLVLFELFLHWIKKREKRYFE